jgi:hypothetical protein
MPIHVCPRCQRANPAEAEFCHFDGAVLRALAGGVYHQLPEEFIFPSGRRCRSYDDLVQGCHYEWDDARDLLRQGRFSQFLARIGRMDLVRAAAECQSNNADPDVALLNFIGRLPAYQVQGPRLDLHPRRLVLGALRAGESRQVQLIVTNVGKGLLHGTLKVSEGGNWLYVAEGGGSNGQCTLKTAREQVVNLRIETRGLAAPQTYGAKLTVVTNGGIVEVPVRLDLTAVPFPRQPFQGVTNPRALAERMRTNPRPAVAMLEGGEVKKWFQANGWTYPVAGRPAKGVAAVQQFFEGMGLSRPPSVEVSQTVVEVRCQQPELAQGQVTLRTGAKKWVYAQVDSDKHWLRVPGSSFSGPQQAVIHFEVDTTLMDADRVHEGTLHLHCNAGQRLDVRVRADVRRPGLPLGQLLLRPVAVGALLGLAYRLLFALPADLFARVLLAAPNPDQPPGSLLSWTASPLAEPAFLRNFVLLTGWLGAVLVALVLWRRGSRWTDVACGAIAGTVTGLAGSATLACLAPWLDSLPRLVWQLPVALFKGTSGAASAWLWTPAWMIVSALCWAVLGGTAAFLLRFAGRWGQPLLAKAAAPLAGLLGMLGMKRASAYLALE